jgi:glucose-1-phosphate cytidylyltransferase
MKVLILCGGQGTRLREETEYRPKPLVPIGGRPVLWHVMKLYAHYGLTDFLLCLGYRGQMIKEYFLNYEEMNSDFTICLGKNKQITYYDQHQEETFQVTLADTGEETMTGGRVLRAARHLYEDTFMVTYGDGLSDIDIGKLLDFHYSHGKLATVTSVRPVSRFGVLDAESGGQVVNFREKPQIEGWVSCGYFVFERAALGYLDGDQCILEREPLERLVADGELMTFRHEGFFYPMDTYREFLYLNELWKSGNAPWKVWE